jgi:hypothetical protein
MIATLSLCTFVWAQAADGEDFYNQTVASQAQQNSFAVAAIAQSAAVSAQSESWNSEQPGSIASNSGADFFDATVQSQATLNGLIKAAITQSSWNEQETMPAMRETSSVADPQSMASDDGMQSADADFYGQKVDEQANLNSSFLSANRLTASVQPEGWSGSDQPGSMAANEGSPSTSEDLDFFSQTIAIQSNVNRLLQDSKQQQSNQ